MITSRQNQKVKDVVKLHSKKHRYIRGAFLVEGKKLYDEALKAGFELEELYSLHPLEGAQVVSESVLSAMATTVTPQDIIAIFKQKIKTTDNIDKCIILDNIQDPGNMGSIIRSALGAGFYTIIAVNCVDKYDPKVIRSSMGAVLHTNVIECDFKECMELVEQANLKMAICSMEGQSIFEAMIRML